MNGHPLWLRPRAYELPAGKRFSVQQARLSRRRASALRVPRTANVLPTKRTEAVGGERWRTVAIGLNPALANGNERTRAVADGTPGRFHKPRVGGSIPPTATIWKHAKRHRFSMLRES
jgi:hypothetical protein